MAAVDPQLIQNFRAPAFPGSYFISFEGIEGAGKSTQIVQTKEFLESAGYRVLVLREPGGTSFGEKLRQAILNTKTELHPMSEALLFASSRAQLLQEVILKELEVPNTVVICDRYMDSSLAYQGVARGLGAEVILRIHDHFPLNLVPHLTLYLSIDLETSHHRQKIRNAPKDYFEAQGDQFYQKLIEGYEEAYQLFPQRICKIDATGEFEQIKQDILAALNQLIHKK